MIQIFRFIRDKQIKSKKRKYNFDKNKFNNSFNQQDDNKQKND